MTKHTLAKPRQAFTLLEMVLSMVIGVLLMSGLYIALDIHMTASNSGRLQVDQAQVARNVLRRVAADIKSQLATLDAYPTPTPASTTTTTAAATATEPVTVPFNLGVRGETDWLAIYISKVPAAATMLLGDSMTRPEDQVMDSDLRRITYWLVPASDGSGGLAYQEVRVVTSEMELGELPPVMDERAKILAPEIIAVTFEYFDGAAWQESWDGSALKEDGVTVVGPPVAIGITISVARPDNVAVGTDDPKVRQFKQVVQIPTASFPNSNGGGAP